MKATKSSILFVIIFLTLFTCACHAANMVGRQAPDFTVKYWLSDNKLGPGDLQGRVYVIEFWATWCGPCVQITPWMSLLAEKYKKDEVIFLALSLDRSPDAAKHFVKKYNLKHFVAMDAGLSNKLGVRYLPDVYVVDHKGKIVWKGHPGLQEFEAAITDSVGNAPPAMLKDIDLGPFENMRLQLSGIKGFSQAYKKLRLEARKDDSKDAKFAGSIIEVIDEMLAKKLEKIEETTMEKPDEALVELKKFSFKFRGSPAADIAKQKYEKLKTKLESKTEAPSKESVNKKVS